MGKSVIDGQGPERRFPTPFLGLSLPLSLPPFLGICAFQSFFWGPPTPNTHSLGGFLGSQGAAKELKNSWPKALAPEFMLLPLLTPIPLDTSPTVMWPVKTPLARSTEFYGSSGQPLGPSKGNWDPARGCGLSKELGRGAGVLVSWPRPDSSLTANAGPGGHCYCQDVSSSPAAWDTAFLFQSQSRALSLQGLAFPPWFTV